MIRPFIDAHVHLNTLSTEKMEKARQFGVSFLSINTDIPFFISLEQQREKAMTLAGQYPGMVKFITSFSVDGFHEQGWAQKALKEIEVGLAAGAVGVKIWKNIGMELKDEKGEFVMLDHPGFDPLFEYFEQNGILVIGHLGEPKNCWLPLEEMTVDSDREYFSQHPEYHMHLHPDYPSYEDQIRARDNRLKRHPNLKFVGLHLASLEWSVKEVGQWLDRFPNAMTDLAERICHLQYQARENWQGVRDFMVNYQDRIIYGTDVIDDGSLSAEEVANKMEKLWKFHYDFIANNEVLTTTEFKGQFKGLGLEEPVLEKVFRLNAQKTYGFTDR
jgi:predicted TIM-barrel fold metal-dependent hydrolase